ncbi:MAG: hypothetical protein KAW41_00605 [Candidatus Diapherotrites archaeon]|nr:hypothetical protein [Candidatus Diapherotrites archaeon]
MQVDIVLIEAFGTAFFFLLFIVSAYFYGSNPKNKIPIYLSIAMMFLAFREAMYFLSDSGVLDAGFRAYGGIVSFFAGVLFLYVFIAEEKAMKDIRRIRNAFK